MFEAAVALKGQVQRVIYASSAAVYGPGTGDAPLGDEVVGADDALRRVQSLQRTERPRLLARSGRFERRLAALDRLRRRPRFRRYQRADEGDQSGRGGKDLSHQLRRLAKPPIRRRRRRDLLASPRCAEHEGADAFNVRGDVVPIEIFAATLRAIAPDAQQLITHGSAQLPIAPNLDDSRLQAAFGPLPRTPLETGVRETLDRFSRLRDQAKLDLSDLE